ncbi:MAG: ATP-binding protein [Acidobacteriota bacterium]
MWSRIPRRRLFSLALALLLATVIAGLGSTSFQQKVRSFESVGFIASPAGGSWKVEEVTLPGTGLEAGDLLLMVNGDQAAAEGERLRQMLRGRDLSTLIVQRAETVVDVTYRRPGLQIDWPYLILAAIGIFYLLVGLYTSFKDGRAKARLFALWCSASAALYILTPVPSPAGPVEEMVFFVDQWARLLLPALTLHLFLVFPTPLVVRGRAALLAALYLPAIGLGAFYVDQVFFDGGLAFGLAEAATLALLDRLELLFLAACVVASAVALVTRFRDRAEWENRRQTQFILAGLAGGYAPFLALYLVPFVLGFQPPPWSTVLAVAPLVFVPLGFAYAILKHKLLDLELVLRNAVSYSAAVMVGLFGFQLVQMLLQKGIGDDLAVARNMLTFAAGLALAGVLVPTKNAVASGIERLQHGGRLGQRHSLRALGRELLHERRLDHLCAELVDRLSEGLVVRVNLYLAQQGGFALVRPQEGMPRALGEDAFGDDVWDRPVESISAIDLPGAGSTPQQRLFVAGYRYAFPVTVRGHHLGLAVMSYKFDDEPLSGEDIDLVRGLLDQAALAIENAKLLDEVGHQLEEVTRLEAYNKGILESSPAGIAVVDGHDRVSTCNLAFAAVCGRPRPEAEGVTLAELLPVRPLPETGAGPMEISYCEPNGQERYLQISTARYRGAGSGERVLVVQDVGEQVMMEIELEERERLASLGMLAAGVAHEVNTPLTGISSYAQFLMADTDKADPRYAILEKMERQTFRAAQIVNNLLELARNRRGEMSRVRLDQVVADAVHLIEDRAAKADASLQWSPPETPVHVLGSEGELHQVVTNLVANALDAMATMDGERRVTVTLAAGPRRVRMEIADTGPGIPAERLETIFKPFFSSKLGHGGSGLGLAICQGIVERHGGSIRASNRGSAGEGASGCTFTVEIPVYGAVVS